MRRQSACGGWNVAWQVGFVLVTLMTHASFGADQVTPIFGKERQVTQGAGGRILTNTGVWSPDSQWLVYDIRSDPAGDQFDGSRIEVVHVRTGEVRILYESVHGAHCGVVTHHPHKPQVVFILGPENPTPDWMYGPNHRQGVVVDTRHPGTLTRLDARDLDPSPTPGALRGGTHVYVWDADGDWLAFTYNDALTEPGLRDIGVAIPGHKIRVKSGHPRNHDAEWFSALVTQTVPAPRPGSDEIKRANEEGWVGTSGYVRADGSRQQRAIAFQGQVVTTDGRDVTEVFVVDLPLQLPADLSALGHLSADGRLKTLPGARQRRLTRTADRRFPGIQGTRHWLRSSPDGSQIAFLMKDDAGVSQIWTVSPATGETKQLTKNRFDISSAMSWSADGRWVAHSMAGHVCLTDIQTGKTHPVLSRHDARTDDQELSPAKSHPLGEIRKEACVLAPDGSGVAYVRSKGDAKGSANQICVIEFEKPLTDQ